MGIGHDSARYFDLIHPVPAISIPWPAGRGPFRIREWLNSRFSSKLDAGQVSVRCKRETKNIYIYVKKGRRECEKRKRRDKNKRKGIEESGLIFEPTLLRPSFSIEGHNDVLVGYSRTSLVIFDEP